MPALATTAAQRDPRRARPHIPGDTPRRGELAAWLILAGLLAHLFLAQLTLLLALALDLVSRVTRWRPPWLAALAAAGFLWVLAIGPGRALAGFTAGPHQVLAYLAGVAGQPARVLHPGQAFTGIRQWLPRQAPLALILAPAEAAAAWWLRGRRTGGRDLPPARAGLIVAVRRQVTASRVRAGGVVTRTGACLGVDWPAGRPAAISWRAAEGGVLVTGPDAGCVSAVSFQFVHAAIRRRKPVLIVDLRGIAGLPAELAGICAEAGAPLHVFGPAGQGCYEPLRGGGPARKAALVMGMIDWGPVADHVRRASGGYLSDLFAVAAAAPGDPRVPVLDDVAALLAADALRARMRQVPPYHPRRVPLGERASLTASLMEADPGPASFLAGELTGLRASDLGRWLRPAGPARPGAAPGPGTGPGSGAGPDPGQISLSAVVRDRAVAYFPLDQSRYGRPARMIANLVALDVTAVFAEARRLGTGGDGLAWFGDGEAIARAALAQLISTGSQAGLATVVSTVVSPAASSPAGPGPARATGQIAALANVLVTSGPGDPVLAGFPCAALAEEEFALVVRGPRRQVLPRGRFVRGSKP